MYTVARKCRIPVFGNQFTSEDTDEEAGKIVYHINPYKTLNAPEFVPHHGQSQKFE